MILKYGLAYKYYMFLVFLMKQLNLKKVSTILILFLVVFFFIFKPRDNVITPVFEENTYLKDGILRYSSNINREVVCNNPDLKQYYTSLNIEGFRGNEIQIGRAHV